MFFYVFLFLCVLFSHFVLIHLLNCRQVRQYRNNKKRSLLYYYYYYYFIIEPNLNIQIFSYENNHQDALYRLIYYSKSALHVSGDVFAHHQEHLTLFTVSGSVHPSAPDDGRKHRLKHVELTWNNKLIYIVHLVGYFHSCITMHGFMNVKIFSSLKNKYSNTQLVPRCRHSAYQLQNSIS